MGVISAYIYSLDLQKVQVPTGKFIMRSYRAMLEEKGPLFQMSFVYESLKCLYFQIIHKKEAFFIMLLQKIFQLFWLSFLFVLKVESK